MKLIHSGKVLKDDQKIDSCNIKPNDFLVVMIAKVRKESREYVCTHGMIAITDSISHTQTNIIWLINKG